MRYITEVFSKEPELQVNFLKYMFLVPHIKSMMYIPLNCAIIAQVYYESHSSRHLAIPRTRTQLYKALTHSLLVRHMKMKESDHGYESIFPDGLNEEHMGKFKTLAFFKEDIPDGLVHFGFMNESTEMYAGKGVERTFSFLHLSVQEYLAAWHLANSYSIAFHVAYHRLAVDGCPMYRDYDKEEKGRITSLQQQRSSLVEPAIFLAGVTEWRCQSGDDRNHWEMYLSHDTARVIDPSVLLESLYETQNPTIVPLYFVSGANPRRNILIGSLISSSPAWCTNITSPYEVYALSYSLAHSSDQFSVSLKVSRDDDISLLEAFVKGFEDHNQCIPTRVVQLKVNLELESEQSTNRFLFWLMKAKCWTEIKDLKFESISSIGSYLAHAFLSKLCKVQFLHIHIGSPTSWKWLLALKSLSELKVFHITANNCRSSHDLFCYDCKFKGIICKSTSPGLKSVVVQLEIEDSNDFIFWLTKANCWTQYVEIKLFSRYNISSDLAHKFLRSLVELKFLYVSVKSCEWLPALKDLSELKGFYITDRFNHQLFSHMQGIPAVLDIELQSNSMQYDIYNSMFAGVDALLKVVLRLNQVTTVKLSSIDRETMAGVGSILLHCPSLTTLELKRTRLGYDGVLYICNALRKNTTLKQLVIHDLQLPPFRERREFGDLKHLSFSSIEIIPLPNKTTCSDFLLELNNILKDNTTLLEMKIQSGLFLPLSAGGEGEYCQWTGLGPLQQFNVGAVRSGMSPNLRRSFSSSDLTQPQTQLFWDRKFITSLVLVRQRETIDFEKLFFKRKEMSFSLPSFTAPDTEVLQSFSGLDPRLKECLGMSGYLQKSFMHNFRNLLGEVAFCVRFNMQF